MIDEFGLSIPDFWDGLFCSSIAFSKNRLRSETDFGVFANAGGDYSRKGIKKSRNSNENIIQGINGWIAKIKN